MKKFKEFISRPVVIGLLFVMAAGLLLGTGIEGTQAVLNEQSSPFHATMEVSSIDVELVENDERVAWNGYNSGDKNKNGSLKLHHVNEEKKLKLGYKYPEVLKVRNTGSVPQFVRVTITKYWTEKGADGKRVDLDPSYIVLDGVGAGWQKDENASTAEREVYYYNPVLGGELDPENTKSTTTNNLTETIRIDPAVMNHKVNTKYDYDDLEFHLDARVDAVQNRHIEEAAKNAWGVNVSGNEESMTLVK